MTPPPRRFLAALVALLLAATGPAQAQFAAAISPPRIELDAAPGITVRSVIEITNTATAPSAFKLYTNDWTLGADGKVNFSDDLLPGSCRPWVAIERRQVTVQASARLRYRIEVTPPADTAPVECRFALMVESSEQDVDAGALKLPMSGRIAVIFYVRVGEVRPDLRVVRTLVVSSDGKPVPALEVLNAGQATGRFFGFVSASFEGGAAVDLSPNSVPILPGMQRSVELLPVPPADRPNDKPPTLRWPLRVRGQLETGVPNAPKTAVDALFDTKSN